MADKTRFLEVLARLLDDYLPNQRGLAANTIRSYRHAFRLLLEYLCVVRGAKAESVRFSDLDSRLLTAWLEWLEDARGCSAKTRNQRLAALTTFARYALREDPDHALAFCATVERIPKKRVPEDCVSSHFTRDEIAVLLRMPDAGSKIGIRNRVLLSTLYATGARAQELCDIRIGDVRFGNTPTVTLHGKGSKARTVVIPQKCSDLLRTYIEKTHAKRFDSSDTTYVFSSQTHEHMTISCVEAIVKKYIRQAKLLRQDLFNGHYSPHSFRHSIAMHMLESGIMLPVIKTFLGHVSISTTMVYAAADFAMVSRYLQDKDPYAKMEDASFAEQPSVLPAFLL
jgi:site-specific recombinase XerD